METRRVVELELHQELKGKSIEEQKKFVEIKDKQPSGKGKKKKE
ncbi:hypothetical protein [Microscilla marina]|uniref:Uncharacterized protein n=1 Tax=Microscilla marina ATCC 23134 TaxID=313606 RepID=A1ZTU0_MICM2|nr:hypothetical protein [Microscilla marina]EAY26192.1 hypothetical protein M23134_02524 [Microscilla marina ATCC 23134]